jgi:HisJ family histidinol phosphate phosphatase
LNDNSERDPRLVAIPDTHGHAKGEHKPYAEERPLPLTARMLFLWFYHACRRGYPRFLMVADHMNYLTFEDPAAVNLVRRALKLAQAGDLYGAAETASVDVGHAAVVSEGLRRGMRYSIGAEVDNDPRSRPDAQNIVDAMRPDAIIRSVHFIPIAHPVHGENWPWPFDNPEFSEFYDVVGTDIVWETYVNALVDAIERLPGHIVGHFFVPAVFGHWPDDAKLEAYEDRVLAAAGARQMAVEFNTRFLYRDHTDEEKRRYLDANRRFLRKAKERGVGIAVGSDAHSPKDQGGAFDVVLALLDELEINEIVFPLGGSLRRVALRVVREPEPEPVPEPPAPPPPPEPAKASSRDGAAPEPGAAAAKPVRKARATSKPVRSTVSSAERPPERAEPPAAAPPPPPVPVEDAKPVEPKPVARKAAPHAAPKPPPKAPVKPPTKPEAPPVKAAAKAAPKPALKPVPKPSPKVPVKAKAGHGQAKAVVAKKPAAAATKARPKPVPAKTAAKRAAPSAAKRAAPAKKAAPKKPAPKKPAPKKPVSKKASSARSPAKKAAPAKKKLSKKPAAKKAAPARKTSAAKKTTTKKTAPKRR